MVLIGLTAHCDVIHQSVCAGRHIMGNCNKVYVSLQFICNKLANCVQPRYPF